MCGARKPRLSEPTKVHRSSGVITADARKVRLAHRQAVVGPQRCSADDRAVGRAGPVARAAVPERADQPYAIGDGVEGRLRVGTALVERGAVGNPRPPRRDRTSRRVDVERIRAEALQIQVAAERQRLTRRQLHRHRALKAVDRRAFRLVADRRGRVAVAALVDPLLALAVQRVRERRVIERAEAQALDPDREQVERQIVEIRDEVPVAAEQLVVSIPVILCRAHVARHQARAGIDLPVGPGGAAELPEARVWQPGIHQHVGREPEESGHRRVRVDPAAGTDRPRATTAHGAGHAERRRCVSDHRRNRTRNDEPVPPATLRVPPPARPVGDAERRRLREELDAAAERVAAGTGRSRVREGLQSSRARPARSDRGTC